MPYGENSNVYSSSVEISGRYQIIEKIGQGGMGTVYKVRDKLLSRELALKMLKTEEMGEQEQKRFQREAATIASLRHDNIIRMYEYGEHEQYPYFTMDLISGSNLLALIRDKKKRLLSKNIAEIIMHVADAIHYAHKQGVIHRDIKPENIMIDIDGRPILMDFGLAKIEYAQTKLTHDGMMLGTLIYIAPEYISGDIKEVDAQNDIYALGVIMYEMLTGNNPFYGRNQTEIMDKILFSNPMKPSKKNPRIPKDLETICLKSMARKKRHRYRSASDLRSDLQKFLQGKKISTKVPNNFSFTIQDQKKQIIALTALIIAIVFITIWIVISNLSTNNEDNSNKTIEVEENVEIKTGNTIAMAKYSKISWQTTDMEVSTYGLENSFSDKSVIFKVGSGFEAKFKVDELLISSFFLRVEHAVGGVKSYCPVKLSVNGTFVDNILSSCVGFCSEDYDITQFVRSGNNIIEIIRTQQGQHNYLLRSVAIIKK